MTPRLLNGGNGHVDSGCAHLQAALLVRYPSARDGSAGARNG